MAGQGPGRARARRRLPPRDRWPRALRHLRRRSARRRAACPRADRGAHARRRPPRDRAASAASRPDGAAPAEPQARASATEVEAQSGVAVVRPSGAAAPASVIIQVPGAPAAKLQPAPDERLVERSRSGILPRIGADGSRPAKVYARPPDALLTSGARPAARIAVLVGGLGVSDSVTAEAIAKLPAPVTLGFSPYGGDAGKHVAGARDDGHEVMLQAPMEPFDYPDNDPGPHTLTTDAKAQDNMARLHWAMGRFAGYVGVVNAMGSKMTADEAALAPVLREIGARGLLFLDDGSSSRSRAETVGAAVQTPTARADLVLDRVPRPDAIDKQLAMLETIARQRGVAIGSAGSLPVTIERIAQWARTLEGRGVLLVPVSSAYVRAGGDGSRRASSASVSPMRRHHAHQPRRARFRRTPALGSRTGTRRRRLRLADAARRRRSGRGAVCRRAPRALRGNQRALGGAPRGSARMVLLRFAGAGRGAGLERPLPGAEPEMVRLPLQRRRTRRSTSAVRAEGATGRNSKTGAGRR